MEFEEFILFIEEQYSWIRELHRDNLSDERAVLAHTVKLMEELGELSDAVLSHEKLQRKHKLENHAKEKLEEEFADVVISAFILGHSLGIDAKKALREKIEKLKKRY